jgi:hypothetical protein
MYSRHRARVEIDRERRAQAHDRHLAAAAR